MKVRLGGFNLAIERMSNRLLLFFVLHSWQRIGIFVAASVIAWGMLFAPVAFARQTPPPSESIQPYLNRVINDLTEFRLDNGMKFLVLERHQAPVVSFVTYADVGGVDEPAGKTGVAHFLEHLAFKGTKRIGTRDYAAEKPLLERLDKLSAEIQKLRAADNRLEAALLSAEFERTEAEALSYVKQNELGQIVERAGGVGLNANTSTEATRYFYSFPSNKLELWMSLESERFLEPVFREFYKEKDVILEERRLRVENSPIGQMIEKFLDTAYQVHPYRRPVIGYDQDIRNLTRLDVQQFFDTHYVPNKLTFAIVGDVSAPQVKQLAEVYFGRFPDSSPASEQIPAEPGQKQQRLVEVQLPSQPWYLEGYHRPPITNPDHAVYDIIGRLLSDGRTSRLYKSLVEKQQLALAAQGFSGFPGDKYANLIMFYALTAPGHTVDTVGAALRREVERLTREPVSDIELRRVKTQARADLLRSLKSNLGMGQLLLEYEVKTGSWRNVFRELEAITQVTPADVQRVAKQTFTSENRTVGRLVSK